MMTKPVDSSPSVEPSVLSLAKTLSLPVTRTLTRLFPVGSTCLNFAASVRHASEKSSNVCPKKTQHVIVAGLSTPR